MSVPVVSFFIVISASSIHTKLMEVEQLSLHSVYSSLDSGAGILDGRFVSISRFVSVCFTERERERERETGDSEIGIAEVMGSNTVEDSIFSGLSL